MIDDLRRRSAAEVWKDASAITIKVSFIKILRPVEGEHAIHQRIRVQNAGFSVLAAAAGAEITSPTEGAANVEQFEEGKCHQTSTRSLAAALRFLRAKEVNADALGVSLRCRRRAALDPQRTRGWSWGTGAGS